MSLPNLFELKDHLASYTDTHKAAVMVLNMLGLKVNPKYRLEIFRLIVKLDTDAQYQSRPETAQARKLLERLAMLRGRGLEPPFKNGQYLPRSLDDL